MIAVGDVAPDFEGITHENRRFRLSEARGKRPVVIFFYPGDFTPVCTTEACGFRAMREELSGLSFDLIGVSTDSLETHRRFAESYHLEFPLIEDDGQKIAALFGATNLVCCALKRAKRVTVVIDAEGRIAEIVRAELSARVHVDAARMALQRLSPVQNHA